MSIEQDKQICDAATDGLWKAGEGVEGHPDIFSEHREIIGCEGFWGDYEQDWYDADFISHFNPQKVRQMIERIEELEAVILNAACELAESDIENDDGLKELHSDLVKVLK